MHHDHLTDFIQLLDIRASQLASRATLLHVQNITHPAHHGEYPVTRDKCRFCSIWGQCQSSCDAERMALPSKPRGSLKSLRVCKKRCPGAFQV